MRTYFVIFFSTLLLNSVVIESAKSNDLGNFEGKLIVEALQDGRDMIVQQQLIFIDTSGEKWVVPAGSETDGASVPRAAWFLFPPFSGKYRIAAVVHDRYCQTRDKPWRKVHRMFYDAMLAAGVDRKSAATMYAAVYTFGPRWSIFGPKRGIANNPNLDQEKQNNATIDLAQWIELNNPSLDEIDARVNSVRLREVGLAE